MYVLTMTVASHSTITVCCCSDNKIMNSNPISGTYGCLHYLCVCGVLFRQRTSNRPPTSPRVLPNIHNEDTETIKQEAMGRHRHVTPCWRTGTLCMCQCAQITDWEKHWKTRLITFTVSSFNGMFRGISTNYFNTDEERKGRKIKKGW